MSPEPAPDGAATRFRHVRSVRGRVTIVATLAAGVVLVIASVILVRMQEQTAIDHLDEVLSDEAEAIAQALGNGDPIPPLFDDDRVLLVRAANGETLAADGHFDGLIEVTEPTGDDEGIDLTFDGERHRAVAEGFHTDDGGSGLIVIAEPLDELEDSATDLGTTLRWLVPITLAILVAIIWWVVGLTLRPVERMRREVAGLGIRELDHRVDVPPGGDELSRLAETLNAMIARLETAVRRQQRFVADASHELRTPLARMRAEVEADMIDPTRADTEATLHSQLEEITALQSMVEDMLLLARTDVAVGDAVTETLDLDDIVMDEVRSLVAPTIAVDVSGVSAAQVSGNADELRRLVRNLLDNAARHASARVVVTLAEADGFAVLTIDDDGSGVPDERRDEVFERFRQLDAARSERRSGAGLGLAIVAEITRRHDGFVRIADSPLGGARFTVRLPRP